MNTKKSLFCATLFFVATIQYHSQTLPDPNGYTNKPSYRYPDTINFLYYKTDANNNTFPLTDLAGNSIGINISGFSQNLQTGANTTTGYINGFNYIQPNSWAFPSLGPLPNHLPSGCYLLDLQNGDYNYGKIQIIIKGDTTTADIVVVCPTNTINAYTGYQPYSLYDVNNTTVSFQRPQSIAPNINFDFAFLDWLRETWQPSSVLNPNNYTLNFISDADLDDWNEISEAKLLIIPGHSEYWTRKARLNLDRFVDGDPANNIHGKSALILSGNSIWCQVGYEDSNNNLDTRKLTCIRGENWYTSNDYNSDGLLRTYAWMSTDLKYSVLGSVGCDWLRGGQLNSNSSSYEGPGLKIVHYSPIFNGVTLPINTNITNPNYIPYYIPIQAYGSECDGTFVKTNSDGNAIDINNHIIPDSNQGYNLDNSPQDPILDVKALGFYRAEMVGYNYVKPDPYFNNPNNNQVRCSPLLVFKKSCNSGTIINVSSNKWCIDESISDPSSDWKIYRQPITANMIGLLLDDVNGTLNGSNIFTNTPPAKFAILPAYSSVSYSLCTTDSYVHFTPCGAYLHNAYKVDNGFTSNPHHGTGNQIYYNNRNFITTAIIDPYCTTYQALRIVHEGGDTKPTTSTKPITIVSLFPNPTSGAFTIHINDVVNGNYSLMVMDIYGRVIEQRNNLMNGNNLVDHSELSAGLYLWQVYSGNTIIGKGKVSIVKQN